MAAMSDTQMNTNMHKAFLREIDRIKQGVTSIDWSDQAARQGVAGRYQFFSQVLHEHHSTEDTYLWPKVKTSASPDEIAVLDAMEAEHAALVDVLNRLDKEFAALDASTNSAALATDLDQLREVLAAHCAHEEAEGIQIVQKYLTEEDFKAFKSAVRSAPGSDYVLPWVCDGADQPIVDSTWGMLPPPVRMMVKPMMTRKYRKFSATWV